MTQGPIGDGSTGKGTCRKGQYQSAHYQSAHYQSTKHQELEQFLERAAETTLARIRRDQQRTPVQIRRMLLHLELHLFDPDLDAKQLKRACGVRDNTLPIQFHNVLSLPPYTYIEDCRMEVACNLLRDTDLMVWKIAQLLGYSALQVFSRAFKRWSGTRPTEFRLRSKHPSMPLAAMLRTTRGALEKHEADALSRHLARLYPESFPLAR